MTTATANDRLRQIAILISSVDAAAARQLLLHLPTDKAKQVRAMAAQLGTVSAEEKQRILADFQRSAVSPQLNRESPSLDSRPQATDKAYGMPTTKVVERSMPSKLDPRLGSEQPSESSEGAGWARLGTQALVRFVQGERSAVTAVVISQLAPQTAVEVLRQLSPSVSHDVLQRLAHLQDIDPEAMAAIDEHLSQRLGEHQHRIEGELENRRRMNALLAAAPEELRQQWRQVLNGSAEIAGLATPTISSSEADATSRQPEKSSVDVGDNPLSNLPLTDTRSQTEDEGVNLASALASQTSPSESTADEHILPFSTAASAPAISDVDRSLIQIEFESLLSLPPHALATLLSTAESETVLLALAGATPQFMQRFYRMLNRPDAAALQKRLQKLGPLQLRDVDEAQRRIVELSANLSLGGMQSKKPAGKARRAA